MVDIKEAIQAALTLGFLPSNKSGTGCVPIGKLMWHNPIGQTIIRNEDGIYVVYSMEGDKLADTDTRRAALDWSMHIPNMERRGIVVPESWRSPLTTRLPDVLPLYCNTSNHRDQLVLKLNRNDRQRFSDLPHNQSEQYVVVVDTESNVPYEVRRAPCGSACYCAASAKIAKPIKFRHENGSTVEGYIVGDGVGPTAALYVTVYVTPDTMMHHGLDREARHRNEGMRRQVLRQRIIDN